MAKNIVHAIYILRSMADLTWMREDGFEDKSLGLAPNLKYFNAQICARDSREIVKLVTQLKSNFQIKF